MQDEGSRPMSSAPIIRPRAMSTPIRVERRSAYRVADLQADRSGLPRRRTEEACDDGGRIGCTATARGRRRSGLSPSSHNRVDRLVRTDPNPAAPEESCHHSRSTLSLGSRAACRWGIRHRDAVTTAYQSVDTVLGNRAIRPPGREAGSLVPDGNHGCGSDAWRGQPRITFTWCVLPSSASGIVAPGPSSGFPSSSAATTPRLTPPGFSTTIS